LDNPYDSFLWTGQKKSTVAGGFKNWQLINFMATVFSLDVNGNTNTHWCSKNLHAVHYFPLHNPAVKSLAYSECTQYHSLRRFFHRHKLLTQCSANFNITLMTNMATYTSIFKFWLLIFAGDSEKYVSTCSAKTGRHYLKRNCWCFKPRALLCVENHRDNLG